VVGRPARPVVLACVSAARHRGLQLLHPPTEEHRWVPVHAGGPVPPGLRLHRSQPLAPAREGLESIADMLAHVAECLPSLEALIVWESAVHAGLISIDALRRIRFRRAAARRVAAAASPSSESLLETICLHRLRAIGVEARQQVRLRGHRVDLLVGERLVLQVDGFQHHLAGQRRQDIEHDALLGLDGYRVLRFAYGDVVDRWDHVEALVTATMAQL